jgi:hypothetical protein
VLTLLLGLVRVQWKVKDMDEVLLLHNAIEEFHIQMIKTYGCTVDRKEAGTPIVPHNSADVCVCVYGALTLPILMAGLLMRRLGVMWKECLFLAVINDLPPFTTDPTARDPADSKRT